MKFRKSISRIVFAVFCIVPQVALVGRVDSSQFERDQVEMAFILKMIPFIEWTKPEVSADDPVKIGIWQSDDHYEILKSLVDLLPNKEQYQLYPVDEQTIEGVAGQLDILYCSDVDKWKLHESAVMNMNPHLLVVGTGDDFLNYGAVISFLRKGETVAFEINNKRAKEAGITIRSRLLKKASRVVQ